MKNEKTHSNNSMSDQDVRQAVCQFLTDWEKQPQAISPLLEISLNRTSSEPNQTQKALATNLAAGVIRWHRRLDHYIDGLLTRRKKVNPELRNILRLALFELEFPTDKLRPEYAIVSQAVNLAKTITPGREGFINGVLRSFLRQKDSDLLPEDNDKPKNLAIRHSLPVWLVKKWQSDYGKQTTRILCSKANYFSGTSFRVNRLKITREQFLQSFSAENSEVKLEKGVLGKNAFHSVQAAPLLYSKWFNEGFISVQDEGAQLIAELLNPKAGETILDACAAPGGKSAYLAELCGDRSTIIAADIEPERLSLITETNKRLGVTSIQVTCCDLTKDLPTAVPQIYDKILVDVPCSGLGVIRRRADLRWRKSLEESSELATIQLQILSNCSKYLQVGGHLIYATCTTCRNENQAVLSEFLVQNHNFRLVTREEIEPKYLQKLINNDNFFETSFIEEAQMDGFFAALVTRVS